MGSKTKFLIVFSLVVTALLGGFFLFNNSEKDNEKFSEGEGVGKVKDYTGNLEDRKNIDGAGGEKAEEKEEEVDDEKLVDKVKKEAKEAERKQDEHGYSEHEKRYDLYDLHGKNFSKKQIEEAINKTHEILFLMHDTGDKTEEEIEKKWRRLITESLFNRLDNGEKELFIIEEFSNIEIVPIESDYEGLYIGVYLVSRDNVGLFEFDFYVDGNDVLLDDFILHWSN